MLGPAPPAGHRPRAGHYCGACASVPIFTSSFKNGVAGLARASIHALGHHLKAVAEVLTQGIHNLPSTAVKLALVFAVLGS